MSKGTSIKDALAAWEKENEKKVYLIEKHLISF